MKSKTNISVLDNRGIRVNPSVIIGNTGNGYVSGDILDANAVYNVINGILSNFVMSDTVRNIVVLTQQQYDDLLTKDPNTEYNIID